MGILLLFLEKQAKKMVSFITSLFHPKSIKMLFAQCIGFLICLFLFLFLISSLYFSNIMRDQVYDSMKETMELQNAYINQGFREALIYLSENCIKNADITSLNTTQNLSDIYLNTARIQKTLSIGNYSHSNIGGLFLYSQPRDIFIPQINESWDNSQNNQKCSQLIKELLRKNNQEGTLDQLNLSCWFLLSDGTDYFLVRIMKSRNTYAGAWANLERISSAFKSFQDMNAIMLYVDEYGACIGNPAFEDMVLEPRRSLNEPSYYHVGPFKKYLTVSSQLDSCDYYIMALIPTDYMFRKLAPLYGLMAFLMVWLFLFGIATITVMNYFFNAPSRILTPVISSMRSGKFDSRIETDDQFTEIRNITATFNDMIGEIQNLRIHIYEEQIAKKELELQYLKTQVAPHFLINCLNTIFVLSQDKANLDITHRLVTTLSDHLRYTLATRTTVSLEEEICYVKNYLLLTQLRFPDTLSYDIRMEPAVDDAQVFPLILLMLTENSVKANMVMGENFYIWIRGYQYEKEGSPRVHLCHIDSGNGFDGESLQLYNHIMEHPEVMENGYSIGIYNTVMRLKLTLDASAEIHFSNEPGRGARVDIDFPYIPCAREKEEEPISASGEERQRVMRESSGGGYSGGEES